MEEQKLIEQTNSGVDNPQFYEVVVMDSSKQEEDELDSTSDGITVTLKDSTTDEDVPMNVSTSEGILVSQNVVSQGDIQIAELQTTGGSQEVAVVYTSASAVPQIQYVTQTSSSAVGMDEGIQHKIVLQGEQGKQQIVIGEVQTLPQEIQATILNTIEEIKTVKMEDSIQAVPEIDPKDSISGIVGNKTVVHSESSISGVSGITTCARNDQPLDDMVPPQILATEDENTGPDDIPMETNEVQLIQQTVTSTEVITQENTDLPSSEEDKVIDGSCLEEAIEGTSKADESSKGSDEVNMAKFAPLILAPSKRDKSSGMPSKILMDKPRIVSISHGTAGSEGNGQMDVPNFMDGTDGDDISNQEGLSLVQGGAAILTSVDDVSVSQGYVITPSVTVSTKAGVSGQAKTGKGEGEKDTPESLLVNVESLEPKKEAKKIDDGSTGKSTPDGKQKGKKGKNEMLHGMQLLSECAMRLENQDGGPDEEGATEETGKEDETTAEPSTIEEAVEEVPDKEEVVDEESADVDVEKKEEPQLQEVEEVEEEEVETEIEKDSLQEVQLTIQQVASEGHELVAEPILETTGPVQTTTEVVVTSQGQVLKAVPGSNFVSVPMEIGNNQEVVIDSQQISEELIPMVQEEVILEIVEGDQIVVNSSGALNDLYGGQSLEGEKAYIPMQGLASSLMQQQQGNLPSSHRLQTYSQELKRQKKRSKKRGTKHKNVSSSPQSRKRIKKEPSSSGESGRQKYQCHVCQKLFEKMKELRDHLLVHYNTKGYVCDFCNKTFSSSSHLRRHVMIHTGERPHKCDYCGEGFIQAVQLRVHKQRHSHGPPPPLSRAPPKTKKTKKKTKPTKTDKGQKYQCPICKVKHKSKKKIKAHMKIHSNVKTFKCKECNEVFRNKNQLTIHEGRHKGKPELQCSYCGKAFDTSSHMKRHERIHTGEKPYKCQFCDKSFIQGVQLRLHERIHTGERPHVCTYCGKAFARTQYLKRHSCIHTGEKPLQCRFCLERFIQPVQRQQHEKKLHKKKLKKLMAQKQKPGQPPIKLVLRLKKKKGRKGQEVTDSDDSDSESESSETNDSN